MSGEGKKKIGSLEQSRRRTTRILLAVCAVIVLLVAGIVVVKLGASGESHGAAPVSTSPQPAPVTPSPQVVPVPTDAPIPTASGISAAIGAAVKNPDLGKFTGIVADAITGNVLWSTDPSTPMTPASTTKVLTASAALLTLPIDHRVATTVVAGAEPGQLVLVGGGDPTLTATPKGQSGYYANAPHIADLVDQIKASGTAVTSIVVDNSRFTGETMSKGWFPADIAAGYITPIESVMIEGGRLDGTQDESPRSETPALDAGKVLAQALGIDPAAVSLGTAPSGAKTVASVQSAPLGDRLLQMMEHSDNVLAETIGREIAIAAGGEASFTGAVDATATALAAGGFDLTGVSLHDSSGLSVDDLIPADVLDRVMTAAAGAGDPKLRSLLDYLPVAGGTGSLSDRYSSGSRTGAGWVRAKTGTLSTASALSGFVVDQNGRVLTFALMSNDRPPEVSRPALDAIAGALRNCGCT
ncbi:D-alanyl-D-alanine carboxypeptidase/D-alanyl-D-alanine-endopeptidase (penicillin-binding protein 4) [Rhodococcus sp. 27YEA15]|uniref:D-alanyl-D-alanine carboxypeptidase/D-alanyl-D-alanine endopeptidase n=1 Tax=Rhodococcus sp. 27YEA15 TaxID=3156259 RepID=UPI003C7CFCF8